MHQIKDSRPAGQPDRGGAERKLVMITEPEALHPDPGHYDARGDDRYFGGAYETHDDGNPCQTSTDTGCRCLSVVPCQVVS
jgi:hypothetical protein